MHILKCLVLVCAVVPVVSADSIEIDAFTDSKLTGFTTSTEHTYFRAADLIPSADRSTPKSTGTRGPIIVYVCWVFYSVVIFGWSPLRSLNSNRVPKSWLYSIPAFALALWIGTVLWFAWRAGRTEPWLPLACLFAAAVLQTIALIFYVSGWYLFVVDRGGHAPVQRDVHGSGGFPESAFAWSAIAWIVLIENKIDSRMLICASLLWLLPVFGIKHANRLIRLHTSQATDEKRTRSAHSSIDIAILLSQTVAPLVIAAIASTAVVPLRLMCPLVVAVLYFLVYRHDLTIWGVLVRDPRILFSEMSAPNEVALTLRAFVMKQPELKLALLERLRSNSVTLDQIFDVCTVLCDPHLFSNAIADRVVDILSDQQLPATRRGNIAINIPRHTSGGQIILQRIRKDATLVNMLEKVGVKLSKS